MHDRTVPERVVEDPAKRATSYGDAAVAQGLRVAQGDAKKPQPKPPPQPPADPPHVLRARATWKRVFGKDPALAGVRIADLKAHSERHRARWPDVGKLYGTGFQAWVNSKREVYVNTTLVVQAGKRMPEWYVEALLRHEADHVKEFAKVNDVVPSYSAMLRLEAQANRAALLWMDQVTPPKAEEGLFDSVYDDTEALKAKLEARAKVTASEVDHKAWMVAEGMLPEHAPDPGPPARPVSLYVR